MVTKSPGKEVMPLNRENAAISDQGRCVFYGVFCGGCYQRSGGKLREKNEREPDRQSRTERERERDRKAEIKNLLKVFVIFCLTMKNTGLIIIKSMELLCCMYWFH